MTKRTKAAIVLVFAIVGVFANVHSQTAPIDIQSLLAETVKNGRANTRRVMDYTYTFKVTNCKVNKKGEITKKNETVMELYPKTNQFGAVHVSKNGKPLSDKDIDKGRIKAGEELEKAELEKQNPSKPQIPAGPYDERNIVRYGFGQFGFGDLDFLLAAEFSNARREQLNGRDTIALDFHPRAGFQPTNRPFLAPLGKLSGIAWVDATDKALVRLEAWPDVGGNRSEPTVIIANKKWPDGLWASNVIQVNTTKFKDVFNGADMYRIYESSDYKRFNTSVEQTKIEVKKQP